MNENDPHRLTGVNAWSPLLELFGEDEDDVNLKELSIGAGFEVFKDSSHYQCTFLCLFIVDEDVSSQMFLSPCNHGLSPSALKSPIKHFLL